MMEKHKNQHSKIALSHLQWFKEGKELLEPVSTGDETQVHHFSHQTEQAGMKWKPQFLQEPKNSQVYQSA
jgi:hypothetical protein